MTYPTAHAAGVDYEPVSEEVVFLPSLEQVTSQVVNISLIDDTNITGEVKQFQASLNTSQDGVLFASDNRTATINIFNDDSKLLFYHTRCSKWIIVRSTTVSVGRFL